MILNFELLKSILPLNCIFKGNKIIIFSGIQSVYECSENEITWVKPGVKSAKELINSTVSKGIICNLETFHFFSGTFDNKLFIISENPQDVFYHLVNYIYNQINTSIDEPIIHPTAIISPNCKMGCGVKIGAYSVIGSCTIGNNVVIGDYVKIYNCVDIGNNVLIREFCSIGGEGFGFVKGSNGQNIHIPHIGKVVISENVSIYPYTNVDRGTLGSTLIKKGTVIDHYVHIGHNTTTGENNVIAAGVVLAGGSQVENNCFIGVNTVVKEKVIIGSNVLTGMGSVVLRDIPNNEIWVGNPAKFLRER